MKTIKWLNSKRQTDANIKRLIQNIDEPIIQRKIS
jgi:hypothetical protein